LHRPLGGLTGAIVQKFIAEQNIQHFKASLARETDEGRRALLRRLLAEEEVKLAEQRAAEAADRESPN
jgi:hypothetical protein